MRLIARSDNSEELEICPPLKLCLLSSQLSTALTIVFTKDENCSSKRSIGHGVCRPVRFQFLELNFSAKNASAVAGEFVVKISAL